MTGKTASEYFAQVSAEEHLFHLLIAEEFLKEFSKALK